MASNYSNNYGYSSDRIDDDEPPISSTRHRRHERQNNQIQEEMETLRALMDEMESQRRSCGRFTVSDSLMSAVFGGVLVMIISITVYAFNNLYKAIMKRFFTDED